ncbi:MAG TPA: hypothetical protein VFS60_06020 [Thermoanaerobaculia bacterium]|nr:hypothetical protein [Thermoanaerobaculia bacterium]
MNASPRTLALVLTALLAVPAVAGAQWCSGDYFVEQGFPTAGPTETTWRVCWQMQKQFGLVVTGAWFRKDPAAPWVRIFWDARVGEIFVPYHGNQNRFYDIKDFNWDWVPLAPADCPAASGGKLLGPGPDVCKIVHDRGIAWRLDANRRLGEELVLWGAIAAANYNYVVQWTFRDDGMVVGRVAATGANYPGHPTVAHMHSPTWRLDVDLDGWPNDMVHLGTHTENLPGPTATDTAPLIAKEQGFEWKAENFHALHVADANLKNAKGHTSMFHLLPLRYGAQRHMEAFTKLDLWVTRWHPWEIYAADLPSFIEDGESVEKADVVLWYTGPVHHLVRDEDRTEKDGWMAHAMGAEFQFKPHDFFDHTPLFP